MDCLLALWALWLLVSLVTCKVWSFDLYLKKLPCNTVYITHTEFNKASLCHQRLGSPCPSFSLSLSFWLSPWSAEACRANFPARASKTSQDFLRGCPVPMRVVQALSKGFIGFLCNSGNISLFLSFFHFLIVDPRPPGSGPLKDPNTIQ